MLNADLPLLKIGDQAPDFTLPSADDGVISLAQLSKPVALVFLRHLA
jgi:peroxiredoxin